MASAVIFHDPEGINNRELIEIENGASLIDFLIATYGANGFNVPTRICIHDKEIDLGNAEEMNRPLTDYDVVYITHCPQGLDPGTIGLIISLIVTAATILLISPPPTPENPNFQKTNESPNNRLTGQTNIARPLARIPDVYGRMRVYPDLGSRTVSEFINQVKFVTEYLIIGRGSYSLASIKSGETLISDIKDSTFTIFNPSDLIPELIDATDSNEVNGQEVKAPDDDSGFLASSINVEFKATPKEFTSEEPGLAAFEGIEVGTKFAVTETASNNNILTYKAFRKLSVPPEPGFDGFERFTITVEESLTDETVASNVFFTGTESTATIGPFIVPGGTEEIWFDIQAPRGLSDRRTGSSISVSVFFDLILDNIDSAGNILSTETTRVSIVDNTLDARFYTFKVIPLLPGERYQATLKRASGTQNNANFYDTTKWTRLAGVNKLINFDQGDLTSIVLTTRATDQATKSQERKFNTIATRILRTYDTGTQAFIAAAPTAKFADALVEHLTNAFIGNKADADIDLDGLYAIQDALDADATYGDTLGRFSYSFSADKASVKDELITIANAARVFIRKLGNSLEFGRDEIQAVRSTIFNTRNKKPRSEKKTRRLQRPNDHDGIELQWVYETTGEAFIVELPDGGGAVNPKKIDAAGIRNFKQAWNRSTLEFNKLKLQREVVTFESTKDSLISLVGERIANADGTDVLTQSGEVKSVSSLNIETFTPMDFDGNADATVILRDESGVASAELTVTPRLDGIEGFVLPSVPFTIRVRGDLNYQVGTLYTFALTGEQKIRDYLIQKITPKSTDYVGIELINYNAAIYDPDTTQPPDHETTLLSVSLIAVGAGDIIPEPVVTLAILPAENLSWSAAPTGTYEADEADVGDAIAQQTFIVDALGSWDITGVGDTFGTDSGDYRPKVQGFDDQNYEIKISTTGGSPVALGGAIFGSFVPLEGSEGIRVRDNSAGSNVVAVVVEIREIATPSNTTGTASFTLDADGVVPA